MWKKERNRWSGRDPVSTENETPFHGFPCGFPKRKLSTEKFFFSTGNVEKWDQRLEIHGDLPGLNGVPHPLLAPDQRLLNAVVLADIIQNGLRRGNVLAAALQNVLDGPGDRILVCLAAEKVLVGKEFIYDPLQLADVGGGLLRNGKGYLIRQVHPQDGGLVFDNSDPGLKDRRSHVYQKAPLKPGAEAVIQQRHLRGRPVGRQHNLAAGFIEGVEGVEEFILHLFLAGHKLHIVHQQQIGAAVLGPELTAPARPDQFDKLVDKIVSLDVNDFGAGIVPADNVGDGVQEVGFAEAGVPIDQKRVVILGRVLCHGHGGRIGQFVGRAHHKSLKGELLRGETVLLFFLRRALELRKAVVVQDGHLEVRGEDVPQGGLDVF